MKIEQKRWRLWMFIGFALTIGGCDSNDGEEASEDTPKIRTSTNRTSGTSDESIGNLTNRRIDSELEKFLRQSDLDELLSRFARDYRTLSATHRRQFRARITGKVTGENFMEVWSFIKTIPDDSEWVPRFRGVVLRKAARRGAFRPALDVIFEDFGPGSSRNHLLEELFEGGAERLDPKALSSVFEQLKFPKEISAAKNGLKNGLEAGLVFSEEIGNIEKLIRSENEVLREIAREAALRFPRAVVDPNPSGYIERLDQALSFADKSTEINREQVLEEAVDHVRNANEAFAILDAIDSGSADSQSLKLRQDWGGRLAGTMIGGNPKRAIDLATAREDGGELLGSLVTAWINKDVRAAFDWQDQARSKLSNSQQDQISGSFAEKAIAENNMEVAQEWIVRIADTELRADLQKRTEELPSE